MHLRILCTLASVLALSLSAAAQAGMLNPTGAVNIVAAPPSVATGAFESNSVINAFLERQNVTLAADVGADISQPGTSPASNLKNLSPAAIAAGTHVNSYFIHFDAVGDPAPDNAIPLSGSISFDAEVLGLMVLPAAINPSDSTLGSPGTAYATGDANRGLEIPAGPAGTLALDSITLSADRKTISFDLRDAASPDQIRVITAVPEPSTLTLLAIAAAGLFARLRRR